MRTLNKGAAIINKERKEQNMALNIETEVSIKYTDESGTYHFFVGDEIMCCIKEKRYVGRITFIGNYCESGSTEVQPVIYLDTSGNSMIRSEEMVKLKDVTFICKNPFMDGTAPFKENEEFIKSLIDKGFSKEKAEAVSDGLGAAIILSSTPAIKAASYAVKALDNIENGEMSGEELKDVVIDNAKECAAVAVKEYLELLEMLLRKIGRKEKHGLRFSDVINIVSKCWDDLAEQDVDRIAEMAEKVKR